MDTRFLSAVAGALIAVLVQMTPFAHAFGVTADISLVFVLLVGVRNGSFPEYCACAGVPAIVFFSYAGLFRESAIFFCVMIAAYGVRRAVSWQPWFAYYALVVLATLAISSVVGTGPLAARIPLMLREVVVNLLCAAVLYAIPFRRTRA